MCLSSFLCESGTPVEGYVRDRNDRCVNRDRDCHPYSKNGSVEFSPEGGGILRKSFLAIQIVDKTIWFFTLIIAITADNASIG